MKTKFPWLKMRKKTDPELPLEPPLWMKDISNGEYYRFQTESDRKLRKMVLERADENARRLGLDRREFLASAMGMATTLSCIGALTGCSDEKASGGNACVPVEAQFEEEPACKLVDTSEYFIFDVQTHWFNREDGSRFPDSLDPLFGVLYDLADERDYIQNMFLNSPTHMAVLTSWPGATCSDDPMNTDPCGLPLSNENMAKSRDRINRLAGNTQRVIQHVQVLPNDLLGVDKQLEIMTAMKEQGVYGWKMYPGFQSQSIDPRGTSGYFLTDEKAQRVIRHGLSLGVNRFSVHKGLPIGPFFEAEHNYPADVGPAAKEYPEAFFVIYHSAICAGSNTPNEAPPEGPFNPDEERPKGTNALIKSLLVNGIKPNSNVYAEVGSAINQVQGDLTQARHFFGKLMKYVGVDRVLWGTDCVIYGSPKQYIEWFAGLEIPQEMQEEFDYPPLSRENKAKIFGLNAAKLYCVDPAAARCEIEASVLTRVKRQLDEEYGSRRWVFQEPGGPKSWRQYVQDAKRARALGRPG